MSFARRRDETAKENEDEHEVHLDHAVKIRVDQLNDKIRSKQDLYQLLNGYCN
jgi:hypothetical protein